VWLLLVVVLPEAATDWRDSTGGIALLPPLTATLVQISAWLQGNWWWALPSLGAAIVGSFHYGRSRIAPWAFFLALTALTVATAGLVWLGLYQSRYSVL
jgi:type II secretory pathway component PulF